MNSSIKFAFILILCFTIAFIQSSVAFEQIETYTVADGLVGPIVPVVFQDSRGCDLVRFRRGWRKSL